MNDVDGKNRQGASLSYTVCLSFRLGFICVPPSFAVDDDLVQKKKEAARVPGGLLLSCITAA